MSDPSRFPGFRRWRQGWAALATGALAGLVLWGIIALVTGSALLGLAFGLLPGLVTGAGLGLTRRR